MASRLFPSLKPTHRVTEPASSDRAPRGCTWGGETPSPDPTPRACPEPVEGIRVPESRASAFRGYGGHHHPKPEVPDPDVQAVPEAEGAADEPLKIEERPATQHPGGVSFQGLVGQVLVAVPLLRPTPLPHVAAQIFHPIGTRSARKATHVAGRAAAVTGKPSSPTNRASTATPNITFCTCFTGSATPSRMLQARRSDAIGLFPDCKGSVIWEPFWLAPIPKDRSAPILWDRQNYPLGSVSYS